MGEMHRASVGKGAELPCPIQVGHSPQSSMCSPTQKLHIFLKYVGSVPNLDLGDCHFLEEF